MKDRRGLLLLAAVAAQILACTGSSDGDGPGGPSGASGRAEPTMDGGTAMLDADAEQGGGSKDSVTVDSAEGGGIDGGRDQIDADAARGDDSDGSTVAESADGGLSDRCVQVR